MNPYEEELLEQETIREIHEGDRQSAITFLLLMVGLVVYLSVMFGVLKLISKATHYFLGGTS